VLCTAVTAKIDVPAIVVCLKTELVDALKQHILTLISYYKSQGLVRIDTPSFYEMLIYNSTEEAPAEPYPNIDDLINSFLCSKGAEFIV
jgi:hypothetical protein